MSRPSRLALLCLLAALVATPVRADDDGGWQHEATEAGISVSTRTDAGRNLPVFRGVGVVDASLFEVLAVLYDASRFPEWMADCAGSRILRRSGDLERVEYNRTKAPWPVSDRDVVVHARTTGSLAKKEVWSRFEATTFPGAGPVDGVVRMTRLRGYYRLQALDGNRTRVTYQVDADPGGMLPDWLVKRASRRLPIDTIAGLRKQTRKMRGKSQEFLTKFDPAHGGTVPAEFLP